MATKQPPSAENIGVVIYTHERTDDAKMNMEIIRGAWQKPGLFGHIRIVHAYNGQRGWWPKPYLEDILVRQSNPGHFEGAARLIDAGIATLQRRFPKLRYAVILAADTWCVKPEFISAAIRQMKQQQKILASAVWGLPSKTSMFENGLATDFCIVDLQWAKRYKLFPLNWQQFNQRHGELLLFLRGANVSVEKLLVTRLLQASFRSTPNNVQRRGFAARLVLRMSQREPVHSRTDRSGYWVRTFFWPTIGLLTHHDPLAKAKALRRFRLPLGPTVQKFLATKGQGTYNHNRTIRTSYN